MNELICYQVSRGLGVNGVLSCQGDGGEEDEQQDQVGEGRGVDDLVAQLPEPGHQSTVRGWYMKGTS